MRILHTADWHLGKLFYGNYLTEGQAYVLEQQLLPMIRDEGIDAVVLAGDVYDRSLPPAEAVELFDDVATRICTSPSWSSAATTTARPACPLPAASWRRRASIWPVNWSALRVRSS